MTAVKFLQKAGYALRNAPPELQKKLLTVISKRAKKMQKGERMVGRELRVAIHDMASAWEGYWVNSDAEKVTKLTMKCIKGHQFNTTTKSLFIGVWCPECYNPIDGLRKSIEDMHKMAHKHKGRCLSSEYINAFHPLMWECKHGHQWESPPDNVREGNWCVICNEVKRKQAALARMKKIAKSRGGECLSSEFIGYKDYLRFRCAEGHEWDTVPDGIVKGHWCSICRYENRKSRFTLADAQSHAAEKEGKCLSATFVNVNEDLEWECKNRHQWIAPLSRIRQGIWCQRCYWESLSSTLEEMQQIAKDRGGRCLSDQYVDSRTKLNWRCSQGHRWEATPGHIKNGSWCPECSHVQRGLNDKRRLSIEEMQQLAAERGGQCISQEYINSYTKLLWECELGHRWHTRPTRVKSGSWCPECAHLAKCKSDKARRKYLPVPLPKK